MSTKATTKDKVNSTVKKAAEVAKKTGEYASSNPKTVLYIAGGALAVYLIYKTVKGIGKASETLSGDNIDNNIEVANELQINESKLTISDVEATQIAAALLEAMNWFGYVFPVGPSEGTDTDVIEAIFERINSEDFKLIYKKFGKKDYNGFGSPDSNIIGGTQDLLGISEKRDLVYWLRAELHKTFDFIVFPKVREVVEGAGFIFE